MKLSILIPVYNEKNYIRQIVEKVLAQEVPGVSSRELVIVDDHSSDGTAEIIRDLAARHAAKIVSVFHERNRGKGAALQSAIAQMTGELCIVQDADLEYDPQNYPLVLEPIIDGRADCVYGSRFTGSQAKRVLFFWHYVGNRFLTLLSNAFTNLNLTDMETGCKAFRAEVLKCIPLRSRRFGFEPEITAKVAQGRYRVFEVGISYNGRTYEEGKKITWVDGLRAIFTILKFGIVREAVPVKKKLSSGEEK